MVGLLDGVKVIKLIDSQQPILLKDDKATILLSGQPYIYDIDYKDKYKQYYVISKPHNIDFSIHMVHGMLLDKKIFDGAAYTLLDDILDTEADITLSGHYHSGFGIKIINNKYFINPGSLVRMTSSITEIERWPSVAILDISRENGIVANIVKLKSAKPGDEVLDRGYIEQEQFKKHRLASFFQEIGSAGEIKKLDLYSIIQQVANNENIDENIKKEALKRIADAERYMET